MGLRPVVVGTDAGIKADITSAKLGTRMIIARPLRSGH
jgi:hypothetical protein